MDWNRHLRIGADCVPGGGVHFGVWAPDRARVDIVFEDVGRTVALARDEAGFFFGRSAEGIAGSRYRIRLDARDERYPDPASRYQPDGPHGPSEVIDPAAFVWRHDAWKGLAAPEARVLYEMHIGTFTPRGTWESATSQLAALADLGVNVIEVMPVADFVGTFGWGYDGVDLFAPTRLYGRPDDFRHFVDSAHAAGVAVILDVVYNHFGPDGCYLRQFTADYFSDRYTNEWGDSVNFDGTRAQFVRAYFAANAAYWIEEFHLDGLRLDATQQMFDASEHHVIAEIVAAARSAAPGRDLLIVCENETQDARLVRAPQRGGLGADALWNDDFHHAALVAATGHREAYYSDYTGTPQEFVSCARHGFLYQGQVSRWQQQRRGTWAGDLPPHAFIHFLENHDQIANSACGERFVQRTSPGRYRALTALLLLGPQTPLLFQGQEFAASTPFHYFADHSAAIAPDVRRGRADFLAQFPTLATPAVRRALRDPADRDTFERCKLDFGERAAHAAAYALHRDLLHLRRSDPVFNQAGRSPPLGCVLGTHAFGLRYAFGDADDRLLLINLGGDLDLHTLAEPLLAPAPHGVWHLLWSSEDVRYGGGGTVDIETRERFSLPGEAAIVLATAVP